MDDTRVTRDAKVQGDKGTKVQSEERVLYWWVYRRALRRTRGNKGWMFLRDFHGDVAQMQREMKKRGWYQPAFRVEPMVRDGKQVEGRALAVSHPDYSYLILDIHDQFVHISTVSE